MLHLAGDALAVLGHLGAGKAHVVGHDWGSALAWVRRALTAPG
jgi:pimeloyl-ACP methyl ester carboxylesterase